jgi:amino acid permease
MKTDTVLHPTIQRVRRWFRRHLITYAVAMGAGAFILIFFRQMGFHPTVLLIPVIWGGVLLGHWLLTQQLTGVIDQAESHPRRPYESLSAALRLRLEEQVRTTHRQQQAEWFRYGWITTLVALVMAWIIVPILGGPFAYSANSVMWSLIAFSLGGLLAAFCHWRGYRVTSDESTRTLRDQLLGRLIQTEWESDADSEKAKRTLTLSDDGELVEVDEFQGSPTSVSALR